MICTPPPAMLRRTMAAARLQGVVVMRDFADIAAVAAARKGGAEALERLLAETPTLPPERVAETPDHRVLAAMTRRVFYAGFSFAVVDLKWDAFEAAFRAFDPRACAFLTEDDVDALAKDPGIVRNVAKIRSVVHNAGLVLELASSHGSAAAFLAQWPDEDFVGLVDFLKKKGSHLGGESAMRFLRSLGKPAFVASADVVTALIREGVLERPPSAKRDFAAVQDAFNRWSAQSGRSLTDISRVLAMSVDSAPTGRRAAFGKV